MIRILLALVIGLSAGFWLIFRKLKDLLLTARIITALVAGVFFLRAILGETYFFAPCLVFQTLIFSLGFIYFTYLYININYKYKFNPINLASANNSGFRFSFDWADKILGLFVFGLGISAYFSVYKQASISSLFYFLSLFVWYKLISSLPQHKNLSSIFQTIIFCASFCLIVYGFYQYSIGFESMRKFLAQNPEQMIQTQEFIRRMKSNVVFSTFLYAPAFGCYLSMMFLTILGFCLSEGSLLKTKFNSVLLFKYLILIAIIPLLILTKAKGAWMALLLSLICFFILLRPKTRDKSLLFKSILGLSGLFIASFMLISSSDKIHLPKMINFIASFEVRWEYWKATWAMICQRPIFGFGPGTFSSVYPLFKTLNGEETIMAHNSFLQIWAEGGSLVFIVFILFWLKFLQQAIVNLKKITDSSRFISIGLFCSIICFLLINLIDFSLFDQQTALIAFGLLGLLQYHLSLGLNIKSELSDISSKNKPFWGWLKQICLVLVCLFLAVLIFYAMQMYTALAYDEKASQEYINNNYPHALSLADKAINLQKNCAEYYFHRGIILEKMISNPNISIAEKKELLNQIISNFQTAVNLDRFLPRYHYKLGQVLFNSGQKQDLQIAEQEFKKAAELYPVQPFYHEQLAQFYGILGRPEDSEKEKKQAEYLKKFYKKGTR
ncbi:MAG: O-antigen ligase family protein [Candidatus Omnitrophica bacterium]|nr:O-antigen ligase family protein [Candidatus Omnitrophota bacterium]